MPSPAATAAISGVGGGVAGLIIGVLTCLIFIHVRNASDSEQGLQSRPVAEAESHPVSGEQLEDVEDSEDPEDHETDPTILRQRIIQTYSRNLFPRIRDRRDFSALKDSISSLSGFVSIYCQDFRKLSSPRPKFDEGALAVLMGSGDHVRQVVDLLNDDRSLKVDYGVRIILGRAILSRIDPLGDPETTLLFPNVLRLYRDILARADDEKSKLLKDGWRSVTGDILDTVPPYFIYETFKAIPPGDVRHDRIRDLVDLIMDVLHPLIADDADLEAMKGHMNESLQDVAAVGFTLFRQMSELTIHWEPPPSDKDKLVIFPAFRQLLKRQQRLNRVVVGYRTEDLQVLPPRYGTD